MLTHLSCPFSLLITSDLVFLKFHIQGYISFNCLFSRSTFFSQSQSLLEELFASHSSDLQQRAYEFQAILGLDANAIENIMPLDASCEDIEVTFCAYILLFQICSVCYFLLAILLQNHLRVTIGAAWVSAPLSNFCNIFKMYGVFIFCPQKTLIRKKSLKLKLNLPVSLKTLLLGLSHNEQSLNLLISP